MSDNKSDKLSQQKNVTVLRIIYPLWMIVGMFSLLVVPSILIVKDDAIKTASNIASNELLFRAGIVSSLLTQLIFIVAAIFLYQLFKNVNNNQAKLMAVLAFISVPIAMLNELNNFAALLSVNNPTQLKFFLDLAAQGVIIASIFWGLWLFPLGYLVYSSGYFPKSIGYAVIVGGIGYTMGSFLKLLAPDLTTLYDIFNFMTFGEIVFLAWLVFMGANLQRHPR